MSFLSYIFNFPTILAMLCFGFTGVFPEAFLPDMKMSDPSFYYKTFSSVMVSQFNSNYIKILDSKWAIEASLGRIHATGALDVEKSPFPITTPFPLPFGTDKEAIPEIAKLTSEEEETITKQREFRPNNFIKATELAMLILSFIGVTYLIIIPHFGPEESGFVNAFGIGTRGKQPISGLHSLVAGGILVLLIIRPFLVTLYFLGNFCEQNGDLSGDSYVCVLTQRFCGALRKTYVKKR